MHGQEYISIPRTIIGENYAEIIKGHLQEFSFFTPEEPLIEFLAVDKTVPGGFKGVSEVFRGVSGFVKSAQGIPR